MEIKSSILAILFFLGTVFLGTQEVVYYPDPPLVHRLTWLGDPYALRYEILIEKEENGEFLSLVNEITTALSIELSLIPGIYRFGVIPHDLLGRRHNEALEWRAFEVLPALRPEPINFYPTSYTPGVETILTLDIYGRNLIGGAEVSLRLLDDETESVIDSIIPRELSVLDNDRGLQLTLDTLQLDTGAYEILIRNPGGMESGIRSFIVNMPLEITSITQPEESPQPVTVPQTEKPAEPIAEPINEKRGIEIYLEAGWAPMAAIYGQNNIIFGENILPISTLFRSGMVFPNQKFFDYGFELGLSYYVYLATANIYGIGGHSASIESNFLMQRSFGQSSTLSLRAGFGINMPISYNLEVSKRPENSTMYINLGSSAVFPIRDSKTYFGTGLDFSIVLSTDNPSGILRPWLGIGRRF